MENIFILHIKKYLDPHRGSRVQTPEDEMVINIQSIVNEGNEEKIISHLNFIRERIGNTIPGDEIIRKIQVIIEIITVYTNNRDANNNL